MLMPLPVHGLSNYCLRVCAKAGPRGVLCFFLGIFMVMYSGIHPVPGKTLYTYASIEWPSDNTTVLVLASDIWHSR